MSWLKKFGTLLKRGPKNRNQLMTLLRLATDRGILSPDILKMIESVLRISGMQARDVMVAASQMIVISHDSTLETILPIIIESGHSRFPVMEGQEVAGILLAKDLLSYYSTAGHEPFQMKDVMRPAFFVPQSKRLDILLRDFRIKRNHIAVIVDEYGHVAGFITIEDVLEEIVGEIEDEYDTDEEDDIRKRADNIFLVRGTTPIPDFNEYFGTELRDNEFDTISGLVLKAFGHFPVRGETTRLGNFRFKVLHSDSRRIHMLEVKQQNTKKNG